MLNTTQRKKLFSLLRSISPKEEIPILLLQELNHSLKEKPTPEVKVESPDLSPILEMQKQLVIAIREQTNALLNKPETKTVSPEDVKKVTDEIQRELWMVKQGTGASAYQAWRTDSTFDGTLEGNVNGVNTSYTLRIIPKPNSLHLYWNGVLQTPVSDYTLTQKSVRMILTPATNDVLTAIYPN